MQYRQASVTCYFPPERMNTSEPASCPISLRLCTSLTRASQASPNTCFRGMPNSGIFMYRIEYDCLFPGSGCKLCVNTTHPFGAIRRITYCANPSNFVPLALKPYGFKSSFNLSLRPASSSLPRVVLCLHNMTFGYPQALQTAPDMTLPSSQSLAAKIDMSHRHQS